MRKTTVITLGIVRIAGIVQLILGTLFWTGRAYQYVPAHMAIGVLLVLSLWMLAVIALSARVRRGLAVFALVWGVALPLFGMKQATILAGPQHWIIRVVHLLMGIVALAVADRLAKAVLAASPQFPESNGTRSSPAARTMS
jgi:hypothetical protein